MGRPPPGGRGHGHGNPGGVVVARRRPLMTAFDRIVREQAVLQEVLGII
jgi:hypothetical protein